MANWYYAVAGQTEGPVDTDTLRSLARQGALTPSSYVIPEGEQTWQALSDVEATVGLTRNALGTYADLAAPAPPPAPPEPVSGWAAPTPGTGWETPPQNTGWENPPQNTGWGAPPQGAGWGAPAQGAGWGAPAPDAGQQQPPWNQPGQPSWGEQSWTNPAPAGWALPGTAGPNGEPMAGWWTRLFAKLIDAILLFVPFVIVLMVVAGQEIQERLDNNDGGITFSSGPLTTWVSIASYVVGFVYYAVLNGKGQTLGKKILGIKVVDATTGGPIGTGRGMLRHLLQLLSWLFICVGGVFVLVDALWPLWDNRKQALHDKIGRSLVVKAN